MIIIFAVVFIIIIMYNTACYFIVQYFQHVALYK